MECIAANRGRPNTRNYGAIKAGESGVETETGKKKGRVERDRDYESGERFRRPLSPHCAG